MEQNHETPAAAEPIRVLLVDDQAMMGEVVRRMLAGQPEFEFRATHEPTKALEAIRAFSPTVILLDLEMPGVGGFEILEALRADASLAEVPVVMLTGREEPETKAAAFERGANDYLVKFPDAVELVARVRRHAKAHRAAVERVRRVEDGRAQERRAADRRNPFGFTPETPAECDVAIVGGGFSGLMALVRMTARAPGASAAIFERRPRPGPGVAYGACDGEHRLNVPAARMGAFADRPTAFHEWLEREMPGRFGSSDFAPRALFGRFMVETVRSAVGAPGPRRAFVSDAVVHLERQPLGYELLLSSGRMVRARGVILAIGLPPARAPWRGVDPAAVAAIPRRLLVEDPWEPGVLDGIDPAGTVLVVGSGLTAIDVVMRLRRTGHRGRIVLASRNGRLPLPHAASHGAPATYDVAELEKGPNEAFRAIRRAAREELAHGHAWQSAIDGVRPHVVRIWRAWSVAHRREFLKRLRPLWEVHRHRVPPDLLEMLQSEARAGTLELAAATVRGIAQTGPESVRIRLRTSDGTERELEAARLVNCVGPTMSVGETVDPLLGSLLRGGIASVDELGLGLRSDLEGRLLAADGSIAPAIRLVGALRRGELWETTAVPELRVQAAAAADSLAAELGLASGAPA